MGLFVSTALTSDTKHTTEQQLGTAGELILIRPTDIINLFKHLFIEIHTGLLYDLVRHGALDAHQIIIVARIICPLIRFIQSSLLFSLSGV